MATVNIAKALQPQGSIGGSSKVREEPIGDSSWLMKIKYDPATLQLTVTTKDGGEYVHFFVYPMTVDQLMQSPSKGRFYATQIKGKGPSSRLVDKTTGPRLRNPAKAPAYSKTKPNGRTYHGR